MIEIKSPYIEYINDKCRLCCELIEDSNSRVIWYEFDSEYKEYVCTDRIDGFLVNIILYCMRNNHDIKTTCMISEKLYYQITKILMPAINRNIKKYSIIKIEAVLNNKIINNQQAVATGVSGGVDSFYTILSNCDNLAKSFNITHLTFFNAGASGSYGGDEARCLFHNRLKKVQPIADKLKLPLIAVDTNINEFLMQDHEQTHTFRSLAIPLIFQKLFSVYYYASGCSFENFKFEYADTAYYDLLICNCLSTENIEFYSDGGEINRMGKVKYIASHGITQEYLNVCIKDSYNCGICSKCKRTLLELYAMDNLDKFKKVFNLDVFYKNKSKYIAEVILNRKKDIFSSDIYICLKEKGYIPLSSKTIWLFEKMSIAIIKSLYHKLRGSGQSECDKRWKE